VADDVRDQRRYAASNGHRHGGTGTQSAARLPTRSFLRTAHR
jgi:hypothetical protein